MGEDRTLVAKNHVTSQKDRIETGNPDSITPPSPHTQPRAGLRAHSCYAHRFPPIRGKKTQFNRKFRQAVTGTAAATATTSSSGRMFSDVTRVDCEEALVGLQLAVGCGVRMCADGAQLAEYVVTLTKSLAELPFK